MQFPYVPANIHHKAGGKITLITGISHTCDKPQDGRSRDYWYFTGNIDWYDGTMSDNTEIMPYSVCCDDAGKPEVDMMMDALNEYLETKGKWFRDDKSGHEGWYANERPTAKKRRAA